jgi:hypothetical protein
MAPGHQLTISASRRLLGSDGTATLAGLERDGLAHRDGARLNLGGRAAPERPTTIER